MKQLALRTTIFGGFVLALAILVFLSILTYRSIQVALDNSRWVAHTQEVMTTTEACFSLLKDAEAGQRGYIITGNEPYLEPYRAAVAELSQSLTKLRSLTSDNTSQQRHLATVEPLIVQKLAELQKTIDLRASQGFAAAQAVVLTDQGKQTMDAIRVIMRDIEREEQVLLQRREAATETSAARTLLAFVVGNLFAFGLVGVASFTINRELRRRQQAEHDLMSLNSTLEQQVADRTAALSQAHADERTQREYFQTTLSSIGDAVIVTDAHGIVTFLNTVAEKVTGWTTVEAAGKLLPEVFRIENEETRQPVENPVAKVLRSGEVTGLANHTVLIRKDGSICSIDDSAAPIRDEQERVLGVILVFRDITERRQTEQALQTAHQQLQFHVENTPLAVIEWDPQWRVRQWSQRAAQLFGWTAEEVQGKRPDEWRFLYEEDLPTIRNSLRQLRKAGRTLRAEPRIVQEKRNYSKTGAILHCEWYLSFLFDATGQLQSVLSFAHDVTTRKQAEAERQRITDELQQFSHIVSHDLNEPLRTMRSFVDLLARHYQGKLDATADEYISFVTDAAQRMQQMIADLLAYTRTGGQRLTFAPVDCEALLVGVLTSLQVATLVD